MSRVRGLTPFQTLGPFFDFGLIIPDGGVVAQPTAAGRHITLEGTVRDGAGESLPDAIIEIWQANAAGKYRHPDDHQNSPIDPGCDGFGRVATDDSGRFGFATVVPGRVPGPDGSLQAPAVFSHGSSRECISKTNHRTPTMPCSRSCRPSGERRSWRNAPVPISTASTSCCRARVRQYSSTSNLPGVRSRFSRFGGRR